MVLRRSGAAPACPPSLVIDTRGMSEVTVNDDNTVRIQAGASLAEVYTALGNAGRAIAAGSCATVGATGLTLGGGVGVLVRAYGLTCDSLTEVEIVTADGKLRTASKSREPELFWACRGGGGGHLGVVTALTLSTHPAPQVTSFSLEWPFSDAAAVVRAWQAWAPEADPRLWSTLKLLAGTRYPEGPGLYLSGTWIGPKAQLAAQLQPLLDAVVAAPSHTGSSTRSYLDAMMGEAGCAGIPLAQCRTGRGGRLARKSFAAASHLPRIPLNNVGIATLLAQVAAASAVPGTRGGRSVDGCPRRRRAHDRPERHGLPPPHRAHDRAVHGHLPERGGSRTLRRLRARIPRRPRAGVGRQRLRQLRRPEPRRPGRVVLRGNAARLAEVSREYDPNGLFRQPQGY